MVGTLKISICTGERLRLSGETDAEHGPLEIEFEIEDDDEEGDTQDDEDGNDGDQTETEAPSQEQPRERQAITLTQQQILRLLGTAGLRGLFANHTDGVRRRAALDDDEDYEDDDDNDFTSYTAWGGRRSRRSKRTGSGYPKVPSEEGRNLMESGNFGLNERRQGTYDRKKKLTYRNMMRELGLGSAGRQRGANKIMSQSMIPNSAADSIINYNARCYSGQFSDDGNFFFSCAQDFRVRMYDTSNPYRWKYYKTAHYLGGQWTITDATLSPDNRFLAYSSIRSAVSLSPTDPENNMDPTILEFSNVGGGTGRRFHGGHFGIWSLRYSGDGQEIVAGTSDESIYVYDIEARQTTLRINGHRDDVNAVCYGDKSSPHILYSGSDDTTIKVWDRRSMGDGREAGALVGHTEGLTYIDSKGDGRYVLSNAKDQTMKLWDLRKMMTTARFDSIRPEDYTTGFDYRFTPYDEEDYEPHPHDCSVVTFRGHKVLKTLIRCHFSPPGSTDGRYVYSGSYDGSVYIWNLDGTLAKKIDVLAATKNSRPVEDERYVDRWEVSSRSTQWQTIVRDASWHPNAPVLAATSWNGWDHGLGTCTIHSWNDSDASSSSSTNEISSDECDNPEMGARLDAQLRHDPRFYNTQTTGNRSGSVISSFRRARLRQRMGLPESTDEDE
ncbi:WD40-repeat-containing domain protein [Delphinella strobiligena]|nr:WD40-repeat-containing domain protein [Delphinella strobiligena]